MTQPPPNEYSPKCDECRCSIYLHKEGSYDPKVENFHDIDYKEQIWTWNLPKLIL